MAKQLVLHPKVVTDKDNTADGPLSTGRNSSAGAASAGFVIIVIIRWQIKLQMELLGFVIICISGNGRGGARKMVCLVVL